MEENSFTKIKSGKERIAAQRLEYSRQSDGLNPRGIKGETFDSIRELMDTLGTTPESEHVAPLRKQFEARLRRRVLDLYNKYLMGRTGSPTHHQFTQTIEKKFLHGFDLYLIAYLRADMKNAPQPYVHVFKATDRGRERTFKETDEKDAYHYERVYLAFGNEVILPREDGDHNFNRDTAMAGYATKYQPVFEDDPEKSAQASYMFEKLRSYEDDFFDNLDTALQSDVSLDKALDFAMYCYGIRGELINEMSECGFTPTETVNFAIGNRTTAEFAFDLYKKQGPAIEAKYRPDVDDKERAWIRGPKMIRHYLFKYPHNIEAGLRVIDEQLTSLQQKYPDVPQRILVEFCIKEPEAYIKEIETFRNDCQALCQLFTVPRTWVPDLPAGTNLFDFYNVQPEAAVALFRSMGKKTLDDVLKNAENVHAEIRKIAEFDGLLVSTQVTRHILRTFLLRNISRLRATEETKRVYKREQNREQEVYDLAEDLYPGASDNEIHNYVELGYGNTAQERIENGYIINDLMNEGRNPSEAQLHIDDCIELYYRYLDAGFPQESSMLNLLKDAISMDSRNPKGFFELTKPWPEAIPVLKSRLEDIE